MNTVDINTVYKSVLDADHAAVVICDLDHAMPSDVKKMCNGADVDMNGLAIVGSQAKNSKQKVAEWL